MDYADFAIDGAPVHRHAAGRHVWGSAPLPKSTSSTLCQLLGVPTSPSEPPSTTHLLQRAARGLVCDRAVMIAGYEEAGYAVPRRGLDREGGAGQAGGSGPSFRLMTRDSGGVPVRVDQYQP